MKKYNATYWCSWGGNTSYANASGGQFSTNKIDLVDIPEVYNTVIIAFIEADSGDHVTPKISASIDVEKIKILQSRGQKVLISIGGETADFAIKTQEHAEVFQKGIIDIISAHHFDGIDLDIETRAMQSDPEIFGQAIVNVMRYFKDKENSDFMLTAAPEFPCLTTSGWYGKLFEVIGIRNMTVIWPQFYNQGVGWGPTIDSGKWDSVTPQKDGMGKYLATWVWVFTTDDGQKVNPGYIRIPKEKMGIGIPAANGASGDPLYVTSPDEMEEAFHQINGPYNTSIVGFMNWSADFDALARKAADKKYDHNAWETGNKAAQLLKIKC